MTSDLVRIAETSSVSLTTDSPIPLVLYGDVEGETVLLTITDTEIGHIAVQMEITAAEMAGFARIVAELAGLGLIVDE